MNTAEKQVDLEDVVSHSGIFKDTACQKVINQYFPLHYTIRLWGPHLPEVDGWLEERWMERHVPFSVSVRKTSS
jgi:hypothetical protein